MPGPDRPDRGPVLSCRRCGRTSVLLALSTWLSQAAEEAAALAEAQAALAEYITVYGGPDAEAMAGTRARLDDAGVGTFETAQEQAARSAALGRLRCGTPPEPQRRAG